MSRFDTTALAQIILGGVGEGRRLSADAAALADRSRRTDLAEQDLLMARAAQQFQIDQANAFAQQQAAEAAAMQQFLLGGVQGASAPAFPQLGGNGNPGAQIPMGPQFGPVPGQMPGMAPEAPMQPGAPGEVPGLMPTAEPLSYTALFDEQMRQIPPDVMHNLPPEVIGSLIERREEAQFRDMQTRVEGSQRQQAYARERSRIAANAEHIRQRYGPELAEEYELRRMAELDKLSASSTNAMIDRHSPEPARQGLGAGFFSTVLDVSDEEAQALDQAYMQGLSLSELTSAVRARRGDEKGKQPQVAEAMAERLMTSYRGPEDNRQAVRAIVEIDLVESGRLTDKTKEILLESGANKNFIADSLRSDVVELREKRKLISEQLKNPTLMGEDRELLTNEFNDTSQKIVGANEELRRLAIPGEPAESKGARKLTPEQIRGMSEGDAVNAIARELGLPEDRATWTAEQTSRFFRRADELGVE